MTAGRPTKYKKEFCDTLPDMFRDGKTVVQVCVELDIHIDTFYDWLKKYPKFSEAYKKGIMYSQAWWEEKAREAVLGKVKCHPATLIFNMKNRFRNNLSSKHHEAETKWTDRTEAKHEIEAEVTNRGYVLTVNVPATIEEWEALANPQQEKTEGDNTNQ